MEKTLIPKDNSLSKTISTPFIRTTKKRTKTGRRRAVWRKKYLHWSCPCAKIRRRLAHVPFSAGLWTLESYLFRSMAHPLVNRLASNLFGLTACFSTFGSILIDGTSIDSTRSF